MGEEREPLSIIRKDPIVLIHREEKTPECDGQITFDSSGGSVCRGCGSPILITESGEKKQPA